jgi:putative phosphoribosyl transferase
MGRTAARFGDRNVAGTELGRRLSSLGLENPVVLGLARGGMPVADEVASALGAPLDVLVVRKIGAPGNPELGIGAIAEGDVLVLDRRSIRQLRVSEEELETAIARAREEVLERVERYRGGRPPLDASGRTAIVVDDGLATGGTARAAVRAVRGHGPRRLILAVPVGAPETVRALSGEVDEIVCLLEPDPMWAVGLWYEHFEPTGDTEIAALLADSAQRARPDAEVSCLEVRIPLQTGGEVIGDLARPNAAGALVMFAHGSGSSRHSPRNRLVGKSLNERGFATLLLDLLRTEEEHDRANVFDIELLSERLVAATRWAAAQAQLGSLPVGYFGASTGAAAALFAAAELDGRIGAVVSRGGRPDLASARLGEVRAPVLLIVGGRDELVLELNRDAQRRLPGASELAIVPGATHLFEEPGALEQVCALAGDWLERHLGTTAASG